MSFQHLSFVDLFKKENLIVEIPMLQRDYAYGRETEAEKRNEFLAKLYEYLVISDSSHELDFIYGSIDSPKGYKVLTLLDGQQRITTLFLLHWYFALAAGKETFDAFRQMMWDDVNSSAKFTYKTRYSSSEFCNSLVNLRTKKRTTDSGNIWVDQADYFIDLLKNGLLNSQTIKNEKWFFMHWNSDPTILNMCCMIDSIAKKFPYDIAKDVYKKLDNSGNDSCITFNFLNMGEYKLTDELYIKMNSRGKPLTRFENLKSKVLQKIDSIEGLPETQSFLAEINVQNSANYAKLRDYVALMIDTKWTDIFWNEWSNIGEKECTVDEMMLSFISNYIIYRNIIHTMSQNGVMSISRNDPLKIEIENMMKLKNKISYEKLLSILFDQKYDHFFDLVRLLDLLTEKDQNNNYHLRKYFSNPLWFFDEEAYFVKIANDYANEKNMDYENKAIYFGYLDYLIKSKGHLNQNEFEDWMRFVFAVVKNSTNLANTADTYCNGLMGLEYLYDKNIQVSLIQKDINKVVTLDRYQLEQEVLQAKLSSNPMWKQSFVKAFNELEYFNGHFYFEMYDCCGLSTADVNNNAQIISFNKYIDYIHSIFPDVKGCPFDSYLIRAMLSKGDYKVLSNSNYSLLQNNGRDLSWRRLLKKEKEDNDYSQKKYFKDVLDDPLFNMQNAQNSLDRIAKNRSLAIEKWRLAFIDYPEILDGLGPDRFLRWNDKSGIKHLCNNEDNYEIDLITKKYITSDHEELFTYAAYKRLLRGTQNVSYKETCRENEPPYLICNFRDGAKAISCFIFYDNDSKFWLKILELPIATFQNDEIVLLQNGFIKNGAIYEKQETDSNLDSFLLNLSNVL